MLIESPLGFPRVSLWLLIPVAVGTATVSFFLIASIVRSHRKGAQTGSEALAGSIAVASSEFAKNAHAYTGTVRIHGEFWNAISPVPISSGQEVVISGRRGLTLYVRTTMEKSSELISETPT